MEPIDLRPQEKRQRKELIIDPAAECVNTQDLVTQIEWSGDYKPTIFVRQGGKLKCYDGDVLATWLKNDDNRFANWVHRHGTEPMDDVGHYGMPDLDPDQPLYVKFYEADFYVQNVFITEIDVGIRNVIYESRYLGMRRIGNVEGVINEISRIHGQAPGENIYELHSPVYLDEIPDDILQAYSKALEIHIETFEDFQSFLKWCEVYSRLVALQEEIELYKMMAQVLLTKMSAQNYFLLVLAFENHFKQR